MVNLRTSGVFNLGALSADNAFEAPSLDLNFNGQVSSGTGDNHFDSVTLLLDGTSTTDDVANSQVFDTVSNVTASSTGGPNSNGPVLDFGSAGSTGYMLDNNPTSLPQGTEDFTVEFWFRRDYVNNSAARTLFAGINGIADRQPDIFLDANNKVNYYHTSSTKIAGTTTIGYQTWYHVAAVRNAGTTTLFVDGVSQGSFSDTGSYTTGTKLALGSYYDGTSWVTGGNSLQGQMTDVRVTRGVARYTSAFTPPSTKLPTAKDATSLDQLATDIVTQNKSGSVQSKYMGPNGELIAGYVTNHVDHSTDFSQWTVANGTLTTGLVDPFGGNAASTFTDSNNNNTGNAYASVATTPPVSVTSKTWSASVWVKKEAAAANNGLLRLNVNNSTDRFDLQFNPETGAYQAFNTGGPSTSSNSFSAHREDFGDWWRFSVSCVLATADYIHNGLYIFPAANTGSFSSTPVPYDSSLTGSITIFGAQLETTATPSQYVPSTASPTSAQVARVEYDASGNPLGLLVEEQRTNLIPQSTGEDLRWPNTSWTSTGFTGPAGEWGYNVNPAGTNLSKVAAPDGTNTAVRFEKPATTYSVARLFMGTTAGAYTCANGATQTVSFWIRNRLAASGNIVMQPYADSNGHADTPAYTQTDMPQNEWVRITHTFTNSSGGTLGTNPARSAWDIEFQTNAAHDFDLWGLQLEEGEASTSYIPTSGAPATRTADDITLATSSFGYSDVAGSVLADFTLASETSTGDYPHVWALSDAAGQSKIAAFVDETATPDNLDLLYRSYANSANPSPYRFRGTVTQPTYGSAVALSMRYAEGNFGSALDGTINTSPTENTSSNETYTGLSRTSVELGGDAVGNAINGHIRRFTYWPRAISDASLASYTTTNPPTTDLVRPTRRWGGMTGRSLVASGNVPTTGVLSLPELLQARYGTGQTSVTASEYLLVAGGGGGGIDAGGGGGAGGYLVNTNAGALSGRYDVYIGAGGAKATSSSAQGSDGSDTYITGPNSFSVTAVGGGGGGSQSSTNGRDGGSGGGARRDQGTPGSAVQSGAQGNDGGIGSATTKVGGGGGGAGAAGSTGTAGHGGDGVTHAILNAISHGEFSSGSYYVAGGGGGANDLNSSYTMPGGLGGGGNGSGDQQTPAGSDGTANTGGGGGGGRPAAYDGGSGVAIIKANAQATSFSGACTETLVSGSYYYKFTGNGSVTFP